MPGEHEFALLGDAPVLEAGRDDDLDFGKSAKVLAGAAVQTDNPLTIGIFGEWGTGGWPTIPEPPPGTVGPLALALVTTLPVAWGMYRVLTFLRD